MESKFSKNKKIDLTGRRVGKLTVIEESEKRNGNPYWKCVCDCGTVKDIASTNLLSKKSNSCGCNRKNSWAIKHGLSRSKEYNTWKAIRRRCSVGSIDYKNYGGRGIKVCDRWQNSFENFYEDMGKAPSSLYSIERINNDGDYEPNNCKWATKKEQNNNKRSNIKILFRDYGLLSIKQIAILTGVNRDTISKKHKMGIDIEEIILKSKKNGRKN